MADRKVVLGRRGLAVLALPGSAAARGPAQAQTDATEAASWPSRPVTLVVAWGAGGSTDLLGRLLAARFAAAFGQPFVVQNRAGATGTIGHAEVARARPDGYTLLLGTSSTYVMAPFLMDRLPYDNQAGFAPIRLLATTALFLLVAPGAPWRDMAALIADARARPPEAIAYASAGPGSAAHLAAELWQSRAGVRLHHVSYRGGAQSAQAVIAGEVGLSFVETAVVMPLVRDGALRPLAVTGAARQPQLPGLPTVAEAGLPGFEAATGFALFAPAGTPAPILRRLDAAARQALAHPDAAARLEALAMNTTDVGPEAFAAYWSAEAAKWGALVRAHGIRAAPP
jgi:tripartite-type tricarboxylate transporter receptor subunit TctC